MTSKAGSWIESSDVLSLFPSLVWKVQLKKERYEAWCMNVGNWLNALRFPIYCKKRNVLISIVFVRFMHQRPEKEGFVWERL